MVMHVRQLVPYNSSLGLVSLPVQSIMRSLLSACCLAVCLGHLRAHEQGRKDMTGRKQQGFD